MVRMFLAVVTLSLASLAVERAGAQPLGTFKWQLQPFCNVVTVQVTQIGPVYTVDGVDDQCGGPQQAPVVGLATLNPDGSIGFGFHVVTVPGGRGVQIDARIALATLSGSWSDSAGNTGTFAFNGNTGGTARPLPPGSPIPPVFALRSDGGFVAGNAGTGVIPASGPGRRMMWYSGKAAFRAGEAAGVEWDDASVGLASTAFGDATRASGDFSTAMGSRTTANGNVSTAMGSGTTASGGASTAMGSGTTASGGASTAMGFRTLASGLFSTAMGDSTTASGENSTAMGESTTASSENSTAMGESTRASGVASTAMGRDSVAAGEEALAAGLRATANGAGSVVLGSDAIAGIAGSGSFLFGDRSTTDDLVGNAVNQFLVRAAGGVVIYSNAEMTRGVQLVPGGTQFTGFSDVNAQRDFRALDGETVLAKLARMPVQEWSYTAQDAAIRHVGPSAQDFYAAFGLGEEPLRIGTMDADGIALAAVQALEARTRDAAALRDRVHALEALNDQLRAQFARETQELHDRLAQLESRLEKR